MNEEYIEKLEQLARECERWKLDYFDERQKVAVMNAKISTSVEKLDEAIKMDNNDNCRNIIIKNTRDYLMEAYNGN